MQADFKRAIQVEIPRHSAVKGIYTSVDLSDAFAIPLPSTASADPETLARFIFSHQPAWIGFLLRLRDAIVACFGLKTSSHLASLSRDDSQRLGIFKVYSTSKTEIILGEDDKHLDFRVSILCSRQDGPHLARTLTASTVVRCHNLLGRSYIRIVAPIHRVVVRSSLRRAARVGWP